MGFWSGGQRSRRGIGASFPRLSTFFDVSIFSIRYDSSTPRSYTNEIAEDRQRTVQVALAGAPNAGKSTLINALVGRKISAVSQKTNTTCRNKVGYFEDGVTQAIILDTPGVVEKRQYIDQKHGERVESAWNIMGSCNVVLLVVDAFRQLLRPDPRIVRLIRTFKDDIHKHKSEKVPQIALVLTKLDKFSADEASLREMSEHLFELSRADDCFLVSGLRGTGLKELRNYITSHANESPWTIDGKTFYNTEQSSIVYEIVREKIFRAYYKEIPYAIEIKALNINDTENDIRVQVKLKVPSSSMKTIVIGKKGSAVSSVEKAVQHELSNTFEKDSHVNISVSCKTDSGYR